MYVQSFMVLIGICCEITASVFSKRLNTKWYFYV